MNRQDNYIKRDVWELAVAVEAFLWEVGTTRRTEIMGTDLLPEIVIKHIANKN
jgi:hypothetical protein